MKKQIKFPKVLEDKLKRAEIAATWPGRFAELKKERGITPSPFCEMFELNLYTFSRHFNGHVVPSWEIIKKVERGLKKYGV